MIGIFNFLYLFTFTYFICFQIAANYSMLGRNYNLPKLARFFETQCSSKYFKHVHPVGGRFNFNFLSSLLLNLTVNELLQLVHIC